MLDFLIKSRTNFIYGCTIMINRKLAKKCLLIPSEAIMNDWWIGLVASIFRKIEYLNYSSILYRQHSKNDTGSKKYNLKYVFKKITRMEGIDLNKYIIQSKAFIEIFENDLNEEIKEMLLDFTTIKKKLYINRILILFKYDLFKQGIIRNIGIIIKI